MGAAPWDGPLDPTYYHAAALEISRRWRGKRTQRAYEAEVLLRTALRYHAGGPRFSPAVGEYWARGQAARRIQGRWRARIHSRLLAMHLVHESSRRLQAAWRRRRARLEAATARRRTCQARYYASRNIQRWWRCVVAINGCPRDRVRRWHVLVVRMGTSSLEGLRAVAAAHDLLRELEQARGLLRRLRRWPLRMLW